MRIPNKVQRGRSEKENTRMKCYCNPLNLEYRYQFLRPVSDKESKGTCTVFREAADPSLILFKGKYYLFPSMTAGFFTSDDLHDWEFHEFLKDMPIYDYAPDVRAVGEYLYFSASKRDEACSFFRTKDPLSEPFEEIQGTFPFWDPNLFQDDDGRLYFYWGCGNTEPIYGVELNPETMTPLTAPAAMFDSHSEERGYERFGEDHIAPKTEAEIWQAVEQIIQNAPEEQKQQQASAGMTEEEMREMLYQYMGNRPFIEGAWMTKHDGTYYLQYAIPGTEYNIYGDGVYISKSPLGPFIPAKNNPYSYKPDGFITGAGHGSTLEDKDGHFWHTASMRISHNHSFERRLGLWKAGFDADGELYCDQRYADWPIDMEKPAFDNPPWMLLSYGKDVEVSSGEGTAYITDENIRTWWRAGTASQGEWCRLDLGKAYDIRAVQINFMDDQLEKALPEGKKTSLFFYEERYIDQVKQRTRWILEGSLDGEKYFTIEDKSEAETDYAHDFILLDGGMMVRYLRLTILELPYREVPCVSGIRVFGLGEGEIPEKAKKVTCIRRGKLDMDVSWEAENVTGVNILWGYAPEKLYHSCMVYGKYHRKIGALVKGQPVFVRVDTFNENGITEGEVMEAV